MRNCLFKCVFTTFLLNVTRCYGYARKCPCFLMDAHWRMEGRMGLIWGLVLKQFRKEEKDKKDGWMTEDGYAEVDSTVPSSGHV